MSPTPTPTPISDVPAESGIDITITDLRDVEGGLLIGADGTQLAVLLPTNQSPDSVCGEAGSPFGETSILNNASQYGGAFGANSPFNPDSIAPPAIVLDGQVIGHLSVSAFVSSPVDPYSVLDWLGCPLLRG